MGAKPTKLLLGEPLINDIPWIEKRILQRFKKRFIPLERRLRDELSKQSEACKKPNNYKIPRISIHLFLKQSENIPKKIVFYNWMLNFKPRNNPKNDYLLM